MILLVHERAFLSNFKKELRRQGKSARDVASLVASIRERRKDMERQLVSWRSSLPGDWFGLCCLILACQRVLNERGGLEPGPALALIDRAFLDASQRVVRSTMRLIFRAGDTPGEVASKVSRWIVPLMRGAIETRLETTDAFAALNVCRCRFCEFFAAAGEGQLTQVLCRYDSIWLAEVSRITGHPHQRPETLSTGASQCRFQFHVDQSHPSRDVVGAR